MSGILLSYSPRTAIACYIAIFFLNFYNIYLLSNILNRLKLHKYITMELNVSLLINMFWFTNIILIIVFIITLLIGKIYILEMSFIVCIKLFILDYLLGYYLKKNLYLGRKPYKYGIVKMI